MGKLRLFLLAVLLTVLQVATPQRAKACDVADYTLNSIIQTSTSPDIWTINSTLCMGAGNLPGGGNPGAIGPTFDFGFGFFTPGGVPITVGFVPATVTSDTLGVTNTGVALGPGFVGSQEFVLYQGPGTSFACQFDAVPCGLPHQECYTFTFTVDVFPDSIRAYGIEGSSNPLGGCFPNSDMSIDFTSLPVAWSDFSGTINEDGIDLNWVTAVEENNDHFRVMRSIDGENYEMLETIAGAGTTRNSSEYEFFDSQPQPGVNYYKIRQVDFDGQFSDSDVLSFTFDPKSELSWNFVGPIPAQSNLNLSFNSGDYQNLSLEVFDVRGQLVRAQELNAEAGINTLSMNVENLLSGIYFIRIRNSQGILERKFVKQ